MSNKTTLSSAFNDTKMRSGLLSTNGMCSFCTAECSGTCEIGLSATRGALAVYPTNTGENQVAGEKQYPIDYSHFNINGRVFGAQGALPDEDQATIYNVKLERTIGTSQPLKLAMPIILPALIKLDWQDYFAGAAMAGVSCVIGEGSPSKDPNVAYENGKLVRFEKLNEILDCFRKYDHGSGQIILQCNTEDDQQGLPEYAIKHCGAEAIEFKFGQSAKGTQPAVQIKTYEEALKKQSSGALVYPDPSAPTVKAACEAGHAPIFFSFARLPMWTDEYLQNRVVELRAMGLKNVYFKMAGYDPKDLEHVLRIASAVKADMVTFDGAGGGSGYSPCKMMNEWGLPAICMEMYLVKICDQLKAEGKYIPAIAMTGGFSTEDQIFKALALGAPYVTAIGLCRSTMAAAMSAKNIGKMVSEGHVPAHLQKYGTTMEEIFAETGTLRILYGEDAASFAPGAVGVYSYLSRIAFGLRHFCALNRKFDVGLLDRHDVIPLTRDARDLLSGAWFDYLG